MLTLRFLLTLISIIQISQACLSTIRHPSEQEFDPKTITSIKWINDLEDIITELNITNHLYEYYEQKQLKNEACHSCPEFESSDCAIFKKDLRCVKPKIWYYRNRYRLFVQFACNRSFHALQRRIIDKIRLDGDYANPNEDDTEHQTYGIHLLHRLNETVQRFPIHGFSNLARENLYCMTDQRWYYRPNYLPIIIRTDHIFCL
ncbi:RNA-binding protein cabeza [Dirofilaria immitis]